MDAATANPYAAIQKRLDAIRSNPKLTAIDRTNLLAMQERRLRNLLGVCSRYQADTEKAAQAQGISHVVAEMRMEAGAGLRESLLLRRRWTRRRWTRRACCPGRTSTG